MYWKLQGHLPKINIDLDIFLDHPLQLFYEWQIERKTARGPMRGSQDSLNFVSYALKHLPNCSFIVFSFDSSENYFVQFGNMGGNIVLDVPFWGITFTPARIIT